LELEDVASSARNYQYLQRHLTGTMDAYASVISNNMNNDYEANDFDFDYLMIPTLIASLYGMNVPNDLENNRYGIWIVIAVSIMFALSFFIQKRKDGFEL
jgi:magnesium transporter